MDERIARQQLVETGKELLRKDLVARTWGNISCRLDHDRFAITPSGLDYLQTEEDDIVIMDLRTGTWTGRRRPSGERGVHIAAYEHFDDVDFVLHTHQTFATAMGLAGFETMDMSETERLALGGVGLAEYGFNGTQELADAVADVLQGGAETVLMKHHGVLICGRDQQEAMERALLLERICRRNIKGMPQEFAAEERTDGTSVEDSVDFRDHGKSEFFNPGAAPGASHLAKSKRAAQLEKRVQQMNSDMCIKVTAAPAVLACADMGEEIPAQLDDMAQMIGGVLPVMKLSSRTGCSRCALGGAASLDLTAAAVPNYLESCDALLIPGIGAVVKTDAEDDAQAMLKLVEKACICALHTSAMNVPASLAADDVKKMRDIYKNQYAKQKNEK